ncbi:uroporphyrinogen-III synthase [Oryzisolibacter propanilivorax]|uniref:uroporphyrinogen-III synthase n=1 Tax=Oryzisolibacter propanilivorax TaxID=1527607 RepID=UPI000B80E7AA|nr:uroporphyrinogen-III synthase [Oryzisolibacter propanilivorax]
MSRAAVPAPRAIVTRPAREAARWTADLCAHGIDAQALPLIEIRTLREPALRQALEQARRDLTRYRALMFVSPNAVAHFFADSESNPALVHMQQWPAAINTRAWAPGPGTAQALRAVGVADVLIDAPPADSAQFDSEALWPVVAAQLRPGDRVLVVRGSQTPAVPGGQGRQWLGEQLQAAGVQADFVAAYERGAPCLDAAQQALARSAAADGALWLLSSSEAVAHLGAALPGADWSRARALATHGRIAQSARAAGFGTVHECRPALADVVASIKSLHVH